MPLPVIPDIPSANFQAGNIVQGHINTTHYIEPNADGSMPVESVGPYPAGAVPKNATSGDHGAVSNAATLPAAPGKTTYIAGFSISATGATSATVVDVTVSDGTWTLTYPLNVPAASAAVQLALLKDTFIPPLPASAPNTAITVTCPNLGTGNTNCCVNAWGYQL